MHVEDTAAWVLRLQAGDETAFEQIYAAYAPQAVRTAALITGDAHLAQDIAQESFVLCMLNIGKLKDAARFRPWFFRILTRCAWQMRKKRASICTPDGEEDLRLIPSFDIYPSDRRARYEALYRALNRLGEKQRTAVILYYFNDFSLREIARICAAPQASIKTRLFAARRRLKQLLQEGELNHEE